MFGKSIFPIGVDITRQSVRMAQLGISGGRPKLIAGGSKPLQQDIEPYSGQWQRSVIEAIKNILSSAPFKKKNVITVMPAVDVFTKEIKKKIASKEGLDELLDTEPKKYLPFDISGALVRHIVLNEHQADSNEKNVLVVAAEKFKVERFLAIFDKTALNVKAVTVWPFVLMNSYSHFFARRKTDAGEIALLVSADPAQCSAVICRGNDILFARAIPCGLNSLNSDKGVEKLIAEIGACIRFFQTGARESLVEKIILFASETAETNLTKSILAVAKKYSIPAHVANVLRAVAGEDTFKKGIDQRATEDDWTCAFGLSLAGLGNQEI